MIIKYRVHEVAKDLAVPSKELIELLDKHFDTPHKHMTALTDDELNVVFEHYTQLKAVQSFNDYFSMQAPKKPEPVQEKTPAAAQPAPEQKPAPAAQPAPEQKPAPAAQPAPEQKPAPAAQPVPEQKPTPTAPAATPHMQEKPAAEREPATRQASQPTAGQSQAAQQQTQRPAAVPQGQAGQQQRPGQFQRPAQGQQQHPGQFQRPAQGQQQRPGQFQRPAQGQQQRPGQFQRPAQGQQQRPGQFQQQRPGQFQRPGQGQQRMGDRPMGERPARPQHTGQFQRPVRQPAPAVRPDFVPRIPGQAPEHPKQTQQPPQQQRQKAIDRSVRHVDTHGAQVELDKYNEHYEEITPDAVRRAASLQQHKQKIKQKSADRRPVRSRKEAEAEKMRRLRIEMQKKQQLKVTIPDELSVGELAARLKVTAAQVIKKLMGMGVMASISDNIDYDTAAVVAIDFGAKVEKEVVVTIEDRLIDDSEDKPEDLKPRDPVVVVMGHVDHGKTSLLDAIRHTDVVSGEAGGITQHIGASRVKVGNRTVTFLDTPGHEAFTAMRARGAQVTDIAVLVVAADDGIMPQTIEAINHARAANITIIVAINKIDKPGANPERVMQELTEHELVPEEWGGDTICVPVSAVKHQNIDKLLEMVLLVADMKELKANPDRAAKGTVIEARLDKGRGPIATMLVQNGTLHVGDVIIAGTAVGHIRAMTGSRGETLTEAGPSIPVEITGLADVPEAGDIFHAVQDERMARELVDQRRHTEKEEQFSTYQKVTLDNLFSQMQLGDIKELDLIVKADVQGSVEAVRQSLEKLSTDEVRVRVIHSGVGAITESDVMLAQASNAIIIGFNVRPDSAAHANAEQAGVEMRMYRVIYDCIEDVQAAMKGMLAPKTREVQLGKAEVRQVYHISNVGTIAGCYVTEGKVARNAMIRVVRDGIVVTEDKIASLKRFKDDAKEVAQGYECGIGLEKFNDLKEGDVFESYNIEEYTEA